MTCTHTLTEHDRAYGGHRCTCCGRYKAHIGECRDCETPTPPRQPHVSFVKAVEPASVGVCMFCSNPSASFRFKGDDTVRICGECVK